MFECFDCGKKYVRRNSLLRHFQTHQKTKRHTCKECNVAFYRQDLLSRHMKLHAQSIPNGRAGSDDSGSRNGQDGSRKRCHTACTRCRSLRIKCSGTFPCGRCLSASRRCNYKHSTGRVSHPLSEPDATPFDSAVNYPPDPRNDEVLSLDRPPSQTQIHKGLPTPNSVPPASVVHTDRPLDTLSAELEAPGIPPFHNVLAVDNNSISQSKAAVDQPDSCADSQVFDFDAISWPLLHESLELATEFDFTTTSSMFGLQPAQSEPISPQVLLEEGGSETPDSPMGANITPWTSYIESGLDGHSRGILTTSLFSLLIFSVSQCPQGACLIPSPSPSSYRCCSNENRLYD